MRSDDPLTSFLNDNRRVVMTRGRKRKVGQRDVWDLIANNDDVSFKHILPRLNSTDLKFLHGVNTETRALMKRSSRADDLRKDFKIEEMSSISTLKFAWENRSLWPSWWGDETYFCIQVLKYLREEVKAPWEVWTAPWAARNGHLHILEYLVERKYDQFCEFACTYAAESGQLDCLKYLRETAKAPWDSKAVREAHEKNHPECLQYLLDNNCPLPEGWRYEHGANPSLSSSPSERSHPSEYPAQPKSTS
ncbi:unnamed protein product [Bathycoccus prasinos]